MKRSMFIYALLAAPLLMAGDRQEMRSAAPDRTQHGASYRKAGCEHPAIPLKGFTNYYTYAQTEKVLLQDSDSTATATLEFLPRHKIRLTLNELTFGREGLVLEGTISPCGVVKMAYTNPPAEMLKGLIEGHVGGTITSGDVGVYVGTFDGARLQAVMRFYSVHPEHHEANDIFETPVIGPVRWKWTIDLLVDE